ncbi:MAG TPA: large-conductance mechanosensitive channel protein MscL [Candidatus Fimihabitans intestinipullorum]|uniref:Large-conductance mechanosensitive channel n=1 Tax=Candidatus Fimihabitans intestinipullorum TaxID=2840820 RepID=A0A9D1HVP3_9BACT|nr:large-conductance mechanosensitive channel protein MscL [Candidatus Fimihabitans intestinipullorum]
MAKKSVNKKELIEKGNSTLKEFKQFISRGNVIDLAVGVIIGSAFGKIVTSIVNDILMPIIGIMIGGLNFSSLVIRVGNATIRYGAFLQNVIDFLIVAACIFIFIKILSKLSKKKEQEEAIQKDEQIKLLEEIRDLLKEKKS